MKQSRNIILDERQNVLGTVVRIVVVDAQTLPAKKAVQEAFAECQRLDLEYSRFRKNNQLTELNAKINVWQEVNPELYFLLEQGLEITKKTGGAFTLGVKTLLENWGYDAEYSLKPSVAARVEAGQPESAQFEFGGQEVQNPAGKILRDVAPGAPILPYELSAPNKVKLFMPIELGGLGKGYALDLMVEKLKDFLNVCIDAGGDLYAKGFSEMSDSTQHGASKKWEILFEHPNDVTMAMGRVSVDGFFLAASNPLKRRWKVKAEEAKSGAMEYHHLVDPISKKPADKMQAVYTQAKIGLLADAYSTALFVMGFDRAKELLSSMQGAQPKKYLENPVQVVEAMLVSPKGEIFKTSGFKGELFVA